MRRGKLVEDVDAALDQVPEVFDRNDLLKALGYEPDRTSLYRIVRGLLREGVITLEVRGSGKIPAKYGKNFEPEEDEEGLSRSP